jgi:hypothetical protein
MDGLVAALPGQHEHFYKAAVTPKAAGSWHSLWTAAGQPGAGAAQGSVNGAVPTSATPGSFVFTNPLTGNSYLGKFSVAGAATGTLILYDRLWHDSGLSATLTTSQAITQPALTRPDALGADVELWAEIYTATTAAATATATYTDQDGNASQSATAAIIAASVAGQMFPFSLAAGDTGVRSVQSVQLSGSMTAGAWGLTLLRRLAEIPISLAGVGNVYDTIALGMPRIYDSACLALMLMASGTTFGPVMGGIDIIQG